MTQANIPTKMNGKQNYDESEQFQNYFRFSAKNLYFFCIGMTREDTTQNMTGKQNYDELEQFQISNFYFSDIANLANGDTANGKQQNTLSESYRYGKYGSKNIDTSDVSIYTKNIHPNNTRDVSQKYMKKTFEKIYTQPVTQLDYVEKYFQRAGYTIDTWATNWGRC